MSASLHVEGVDRKAWLDDSKEWHADKDPSIDVTHLRDSDHLPQYVKDLLYEEMEPGDMNLLADLLAYHAWHKADSHGGMFDETFAMLKTAEWLRYWADWPVTLDGIH